METTKLEHCKVKFTFDVTADEFEKALDKSFEKNKVNANIKGFRKGSVPRHLFEKYYGVEALYTDALNFIIDAKFKEVISNEEAMKGVVGNFQPLVEEKIERGKDFKVSITADTYPEVKLPQYKGIEVVKKNLEITDKDINDAIDTLIKKDITLVENNDKTIEEGDTVVFDYEGTVDGVKFDGGSQENAELKIGSGQFIPGFESQMVGMKVNETKDLNVKFPEQYQAENLAGKDAVFKVTIHTIKEEKKPELTDEYVKSLNVEGVSTLDELKAKKKEDLAASRLKSETDRQFDYIVNTIIDAADFELPESMVEEKANSFKKQYENQASNYKIPFDTFLQLMGTNAEAFNENIQKQAKRQVYFDVIVSELLDKENLRPTEEQLLERAKKDAGKKKAEDVLKTNRNNYLNELTFANLSNLLLSSAVEVDEVSKKFE